MPDNPPEQRTSRSPAEMALLVVVFLVLAAFAVALLTPTICDPSPIRPKISRTKADMRSVATAIESYAIDHGAYPAVDPATIPKPDDFRLSAEFSRRSLALLTTPRAYIAPEKLRDPFADSEPFLYFNLRALKPEDVRRAVQASGGNPIGAPMPGDKGPGDAALAKLAEKGYLLMSIGPDETSYAHSSAKPFRNAGFARAYRYLVDPRSRAGWDFLYDPTNGTQSGGDIVRSGGGVFN